MRRNALCCVFLALVVLGIGLPGKVAAQEQDGPSNRIVEELKNWDWSLGGAAYLIRDGDFYYTAGAKRDLGGLFNWIPDERVYFQFGYLNSKVMTGSGGHEYGYAGFAANANYVVGLGVTGLNNLLDANFKTPALLDRVLATVGVLAAKRMNDEFWTLKEGWDYGLSIDVLKLVTGK